MTRNILICQGRSCRSSGSAQVLAAFQAYSVPDVTVVGCGCLGECGNGPMVLILPEEIWYSHVQPSQVAMLYEHLS